MREKEKQVVCPLKPPRLHLIFTNTHTHTFLQDRQNISQPPHCSPLALEGAQRPPHLSPSPTTDLAAASRLSRSHESSSINVNHQAFPRCFYHSTPLLWGAPSSSVLGPLSFTHWPRLRFFSTVGWGKPTLLWMLCENWRRINTSVQTQTLHVCVARRFFRGSELSEQPTLLCSGPGPEMASMCCHICTTAGLWPKDCPFHFFKDAEGQL